MGKSQKKFAKMTTLIIIGSFIFLNLIFLIEVQAAVGAGGGGGDCSGLPSLRSSENVGSPYWENGTTYTDGTEDYNYSTPTIWRSSGDVHDSNLSASDFSTSQDYNYQQNYTRSDIQYQDVKYYKTVYQVEADGSCSPYETNDGTGRNKVDTRTVDTSSRESSSRSADISVILTSDGRYTNGITTFRATATYPDEQSASTTSSSYWVSSVEITVDSENIWIEEDTPSCVQTYGDGHTKGCTPTATVEKNEITYKRMKYYFQNNLSLKSDTKYQDVYRIKSVDIVQNGDKYVDAFRGAPGPDYSCTKTYYNDQTRDCKSQVVEDLNNNGWTIGGGTRIAQYSATIAEGATRSDIETQNFRYVTSVEFSGSTDAYVSTTATYYEDVDLTLTDEYFTVKCEKTFSDGLKRSCIPETEVKYVNSKSQSSGGTHPVLGTFTHNPNQNSWSLGGGFRNNFYRYDENVQNDVWTVRMLYVVQVDLANGTPENQFVAVNETHDKKVYLGNPTKASSPHLTDGYTPPSCQKTYETATTGAVLVRNCYSQMEWNHNFNNWTLGGSERILRFKYKENRKQDEWKIQFTYVRNVDIVVTNPEVYQDQGYGSYTCTKTYFQTYIGGGNTKDCLSRMYVDSDSGQNKNLGGQRRIYYDYKNNASSDLTLQTRIYANTTVIGSVDATSGKTGYRDFYTCDVRWQDSTMKDVTYEDKVWTSSVVSTGEVVNYIGETWNGYTDRKGVSHGPTDRNEFYIVDPKSKGYKIHCTYPDIPTFNNGLALGYGYVTDVYAPVESSVPFNVIGLQSIKIMDETTFAHEADINSSGNKLSGAFGTIAAANFNGVGSPPGNKVFNNKTYQTGHWYNFKAEITWDDGQKTYIVDNGLRPEASWSYLSNDNLGLKQSLSGTASDQNYRIDGRGYKVTGTNTGFPNNAFDHRLSNEDWNTIRFDLFSEENMRKPSGQVNKNISKTYETASAWAHSPLELVIVGPTATEFDVTNQYDSYLVWSDGEAPKQNGTTMIGDNDNPWGTILSKPLKVSNSSYAGWESKEQGLLTPASPVSITFNEFESNNNYRTLSAWWGDKNRNITVPNGFIHWDYQFQQIEILVGTSDTNGDGVINRSDSVGCSSSLPIYGCDLPIDDGSGNVNYRLPKNIIVGETRQNEMEIHFNVTGLSKGTGQ